MCGGWVTTDGATARKMSPSLLISCEGEDFYPMAGSESAQSCRSVYPVFVLAARGLLAPDTWKCKRAQVSLKATIDVPMLGTIIEQNGDGLLEDSHMPVGWPLHIDGAVRQCIHRSATHQELDDMLKENDMKRDSVEINHDAPQWSHNAVWKQKVHGTCKCWEFRLVFHR